MVGIGEMLVEEVEQHVAALAVVARIHRELPEEIFDLRMQHCKGSEAVPKIVEGENRLRARFRRLIFQPYERAPEFYGLR